MLVAKLNSQDQVAERSFQGFEHPGRGGDLGGIFGDGDLDSDGDTDGDADMEVW